MKGEVEGKRVCVTGASGYIASWLVKLLLHRGYTVNATVRNLDDPTKTEHLLALDGAKERLHLFKADLLVEGSFDSAIEGCDGVFHTASPVKFNDEVLDPAVKGTLNVLASCAKSPSFKRVILTSSTAAVVYTGKPRTPNVVVNESWFSDPELCKELKMKWYALSKTMSEIAAWEFAKEKRIDMVSINPAMVVGPLLQPTLNYSSSEIVNLISGKETYPNGVIGWVDVRDVANAHILAYETPSANGRYILAERVVHHAEIVRLLRDINPTLQLPKKCDDDGPMVPTYQVSREKTRSLGMREYIPLEVSIKETLESLKEKGFVNF